MVGSMTMSTTSKRFICLDDESVTMRQTIRESRAKSEGENTVKSSRFRGVIQHFYGKDAKNDEGFFLKKRLDTEAKFS